jgi:pSer/pThr/pTyr-binding forkhead associated (FHA) protein
VTDRGSTNGTFVEGPTGSVQVAPGQRVLVAPGSVLRLGDLRLSVAGEGPDETTTLSPRGGPAGGGR